MPNSPPISKTLVLATAVAALGGLLFGFDTAVIAGTTQALAAVFNLSPATLGVTVSCAIWGTIAGGLLAGSAARRFGGREGLRVTAVLYVVSALGCALVQNWSAFLFARFLGGLAIGGCSVFSPMYIAETAPAALRGRLVACFQLSIVTGILLAYVSNGVLESLYPGRGLWRLELGAAALPAAGFLAALFFIPHSPYWLVRQGRLAEADEVLGRLGYEDARQEIDRIRHSTSHGGRAATHSIFARRFRRPLLLALAMGVFNQFSGINAVLYYLNDIFSQGGFQGVSAGEQAAIIGVANLLFTLLGMSLIDRAGRRPLLMGGAVGMAFALGGVAAVLWTQRRPWLLLPLLIVFIASFAASQGAVLWVYLSEIFPSEIREQGQSFASFWLWLLTAIVSGVFPAVAATWHFAPFFFFAGVMLLQLIVVDRFFPETKGMALQ